jgi:hypothetical protein
MSVRLRPKGFLFPHHDVFDADEGQTTESSTSFQSRITDAARHSRFHPNSQRQQHRRLMFIVIEQHQTALFNDIVTR